MRKFDNTRIDIIGDETLWKGWSHVRSVTFDYTNDNGHTHRLGWEVFDRGEAAAILLHDRKRDIVVLVRQFRIPAHLCGDRAFLLEVPAGSLEKGEDPSEAVVREVLEETGYAIDPPRRLFSAYSSPGSLTEKVHFYVAEIDAGMKRGDGGGLAHEYEDLEILELPVSEALALIESGGIIDMKTITLLQWLALNAR